MVDAYFEQAEKTFTDMDDALCALVSFPSFPPTLIRRFRVKKNLAALSDLGHFLKGSSAALGVSRVQSACEDIQHYGKLREGGTIITEAEAIIKITKALACAREDYGEAKKWLDEFYASYCVEDD
jgi:osomolarity two-component system, phosphorelay intermediate protein YPD1